VSTTKVPKYRELRITNTPEGVVVDFFPDMLVVPIIEKEPTESNPDIKLDLGKIGGNLAPLKAYYPPGTTTEEIMDKVDILFEKVTWCPGCERKKRMVLAKLKKMMEEKGQGEVFEKMMAKAQQKAEEKPKVPERAPEKQYKMEQASVSAKRPLEERLQESLTGAINDTYVAVRGFFVPPVKPIRPDDWMKVVEGKTKKR
jgi:hypothetical protein